MQSVVDLDEKDDSSTWKRKKKSPAELATQKMPRGNLGLCYLDMSLVNLCGVPSLWMDPR